MSRSYRHHPIVKSQARDSKAIANRLYRRRVNAGDFDDYPQRAKAAYRRAVTDPYDVIDWAFRCPWPSVQAEVEATRKTVERNGGALVKAVPERWWTFSRVSHAENGELKVEPVCKRVPAHQEWLIPEHFASFEDWVQFRYQEWQRRYYWK